jgi:lysozyme
MNNQFADVSSNNRGFNAMPYASAGHPVIGIKATESTGYTNPFHAPWVNDAHRHNVPVLHYMFARPEHGDPVGQAEHFLSVIHTDFHRPGDYLVIDLETGSPSTVRGWYEACRDTIRRQGFHPWLYTYVSYLESSNLVAAGELLWIAAYTSRNPAGPLWRLHGYKVAAWQQTDGVNGPQPHSYAGIPGTCDGSVLNRGVLRQVKKAKK